MVLKIRTRPLEFEAFRFGIGEQEHLNWPFWFREALLLPQGKPGSVVLLENGNCLLFSDIEEIDIEEGDFVVRGVGNVLYVYTAVVFKTLFEILNEKEK